ncbi:MAG: RcpC/CpaB family pilus assembly protein [Ornithinimicrobium sp.]
MSRRIVAVVLALVLAVMGTGILYVYVSGADQRAMQGLEPVTVLRVVEPISAGTPVDELDDLVESTEVPVKAVAEGAVSSLDEVDGQVATSDLQPGEQLLLVRFTDTETFEESQPLDIPEGMQQISLLLEPQRVLGGYLEPGATVGVFVSMTEPPETRLILNSTLVTRVQGGVALGRTASASDEAEESAAEEGDPDASPPPADGVMVTLAVELSGAEDIVYGSEHGTIWLSIQSNEAEEGGNRLVDRTQVLQ